MSIKGKLSYIGLLVPVLLFAGVKIFAQTAADGRMPLAGPASLKMTRPHADVLISDRTFIMKSIGGIATSQRFKSQSAATGCSFSAISDGRGKSFPGPCPIVDCAAPPPGCHYEGPVSTDQNGCALDCGHLVCGPDDN